MTFAEPLLRQRHGDLVDTLVELENETPITRHWPSGQTRLMALANTLVIKLNA